MIGAVTRPLSIAGPVIARSAARWVCLVLVVVGLLAPRGLDSLDLCLCDADGHGVFCEPPEQPVAPRSSCCASPPEPEVEAESHERSCPDCPAVELTNDLVLTLPSTAERSLLGLHLTGPTLAYWGSSRSDVRTIRPTDGWPRPPPGRHRLHLLHSVLLV